MSTKFQVQDVGHQPAPFQLFKSLWHPFSAQPTSIDWSNHYLSTHYYLPTHDIAVFLAPLLTQFTTHHPPQAGSSKSRSPTLYPHYRLQNVSSRRNHRLDSLSRQWLCADAHAIPGHGSFDDDGDDDGNLGHGPFHEDDHSNDDGHAGHYRHEDIQHFERDSSRRSFEHGHGRERCDIDKRSIWRRQFCERLVRQYWLGGSGRCGDIERAFVLNLCRDFSAGRDDGDPLRLSWLLASSLLSLLFYIGLDDTVMYLIHSVWLSSNIQTIYTAHACK